MEKVFVYGSLRSDFWNFDKVLKNRVRKIEKGQIQGVLYHLPEGYPAVIKGSSKIAGEVCTIAQRKILKSLDLLEGYLGEGKENLYERRQIEVTLGDGTLEKCWVYLYVNERYAEQKGILIPGGDWKVFMEERKKR